MAETSKTNTIMALINGNAGRVVLFVSCLVLFIMQSGSIYTANNQGNYSVVSVTLAIFMLGLVSAVTQNPKHLEIFAYAAIALALYGCLVNYGQHAEFGPARQIILSELKSYQSNYGEFYPTTTKNDTSKIQRLEVLKWNSFQRKYECCGLEAAHDWNKTADNSTLMPVSCCTAKTLNATDNRCYKYGAFQDDCVSQYDKNENPPSIPWIILHKIFLLALAALSFSAAKHGLSRTDN